MSARGVIFTAMIAGLTVVAQAQPSLPPAPAISAAGTAGVIPMGTPVRLMVMNEVTSRYARIGDRFRLRVDENVVLNGVTVIPAGAIAWGGVIGLGKSGVVGKTGSLNARLLYVDLPGGRVPLRGDRVDSGKGNTAGVALAVVSFGLLGLLNRGNNAKLKAGDMFTGYVDTGSALP